MLVVRTALNVLTVLGRIESGHTILENARTNIVGRRSKVVGRRSKVVGKRTAFSYNVAREGAHDIVPVHLFW